MLFKKLIIDSLSGAMSLLSVKNTAKMFKLVF